MEVGRWMTKLFSFPVKRRFGLRTSWFMVYKLWIGYGVSFRHRFSSTLNTWVSGRMSNWEADYQKTGLAQGQDGGSGKGCFRYSSVDGQDSQQRSQDPMCEFRALQVRDAFWSYRHAFTAEWKLTREHRGKICALTQWRSWAKYKTVTNSKLDWAVTI